MAPPEDAPGHPDYRFTLANERTLLAWLRTALALVAGGVAVATYAPDLGVRWGSAVVALSLVFSGLAVAVLGYRRGGGDQGAVRAGRAPPASGLMATPGPRRAPGG